MKYTKEDIVRMVNEEDIEFIRLQFTDIFGQLKNVAVTKSQIEKVVNNQIMIDGSSIEGFTRIHESDQYLHPDLSTFAVLPWMPAKRKTARLICNVYNPDGTPFIGDPRYVLQRTLDRAARLGYTFNVGPEMEFFLFETDEKGLPTTRTADAASYFDMAPIDHGGDVRREICLMLEEMGFEIEASHHEVAEGQHEIDFKYADALTAADNISTFRMAVKTIAQNHGLHATFMPKPVFGINGSGMHVNMSLSKNGKNIFFDPEGEKGLSKEAYSFIAGILEHVRSFAAITNPLVNSYKRLVPGYEAPCYPRSPGPEHPGGAQMPRPGLQPLPGFGSVSDGRPGRHGKESHAPRRDHGEHLHHDREGAPGPRHRQPPREPAGGGGAVGAGQGHRGYPGGPCVRELYRRQAGRVGRV